jgi:hypothetical protein
VEKAKEIFESARIKPAVVHVESHLTPMNPVLRQTVTRNRPHGLELVEKVSSRTRKICHLNNERELPRRTPKESPSLSIEATTGEEDIQDNLFVR